MTVSELRKALEKWPPNAQIFFCDPCDQTVWNVDSVSTVIDAMSPQERSDPDNVDALIETGLCPCLCNRTIRDQIYRR